MARRSGKWRPWMSAEDYADCKGIEAGLSKRRVENRPKWYDSQIKAMSVNCAPGESWLALMGYG